MPNKQLNKKSTRREKSLRKTEKKTYTKTEKEGDNSKELSPSNCLRTVSNEEANIIIDSFIINKEFKPLYKLGFTVQQGKHPIIKLDGKVVTVIGNVKSGKDKKPLWKTGKLLKIALGLEER